MNELTELEVTAVAALMEERGIALAAPLSAELLTGGRSNLTFRLSDGASSWVLRMPPRVGRTPSAHDVAREFRVTSILGRAGIPVPTPVLLCEDVSLLGGPFAIAEFVPGRTISRRDELDALDDQTVMACADILVKALVAVHDVDIATPGLESLGRPDGYLDRQVRRWSSQWTIVGPSALGVLAEDLAGQLAASLPQQRDTSVVHGDFRIDNTILSLSSPGHVSVAAIVDWELSTIGDPIADVAMMCVYRHPALDHVLGYASAWTSDRLPSSDALASAYEAGGGKQIHHWGFYLALAFYKLAVISAGIDHRYRAGATGAGLEKASEAIEPLLTAGVAALRSNA
jgi:aminoglycoside phosphotransferase (APT) family kinase protein